MVYILVDALDECSEEDRTWLFVVGKLKINEAYQRIDIIVAKYPQSRLPHLPNNIFMGMTRWIRWTLSGRFIDDGRRLRSPTIFSF